MSNPQYIAIDDFVGDDLWQDVAELVVGRVPVDQFDAMVAVGYIDQDGLIIADVGEVAELDE